MNLFPKAIVVAEELRNFGAKERYVWTTGSWLIATYLEQAISNNKARLETAIRRGNIVWNAIPYSLQQVKEISISSETLSKRCPS